MTLTKFLHVELRETLTGFAPDLGDSCTLTPTQIYQGFIFCVSCWKLQMSVYLAMSDHFKSWQHKSNAQCQLLSP